MSFLGTYADLDGQRIGSFRVEGLTGRDASGAPVWRVVHEDAGCNYPQTLPHSKIAPLVQGRSTQASLLCANPACPLSHRESQSETIDEFRRQERRQREQAETAAAEQKRIADVAVAKERAQSVRNAEVQRQYARFVVQQWKAGQTDERICTRERFFSLSDETRQMILDTIQKNPAVRIAGL